MKIVTIVGARPQFIKSAVVSRAMQKFGVQEVLIHTGQHFDEQMSTIFFDEMEIPSASYQLNINQLAGSEMTAQMLSEIAPILRKEQPNYVLVFGDTNSTLAGALAAKQQQLKLVHVEAGLRSFNWAMPEELNRVISDRLSDILFVPSDAAMKNLHKEGYLSMPTKLIRTGDVMLDAARYYSTKITQKATLKSEELPRQFLLCTLHRAENTHDKAQLTLLVNALNHLSKQYAIVLPLHPGTAKKMHEFNLAFTFDTLAPCGYFDMLLLLQKCSLVLTDSGGLQKEAYFFAKNCVTLRSETEWIELVEAGCNILACQHTETIYAAVEKLFNLKNDFSAPLYGDGNSAEYMIQQLIEFNN